MTSTLGDREEMTSTSVQVSSAVPGDQYLGGLGDDDVHVCSGELSRRGGGSISVLGDCGDRYVLIIRQ